jgi:diguanylate cyclase (GGDEF)-like protein
VTGDEALAHVGRVLLDEVRGSDLVARFGGDEFVVLLPNADVTAATELGERVRRALGERSPADWSLGLSFGAADFGSAGRTLDDLVRAADAALYECKRGRERGVRGEPTLRMAISPAV